MPALIHSLAPAKIGSTVVPIKSYSLSPAIVSALDAHSGNEYATLIKVSGADPRIRLTMPFQPVFDIVGFTVYKATVFEIYMALFTDYARASGAVHTKYALATSATAAIQMTGVSVDQDGDLMAEVEVVLLSPDSTTHPLAKTNNNSLPTLASQPTLHTLGPLSVNGTVYPGMMSAGVDLGQTMVTKRHDGDLYPKLAARLGGSPRMFGEHGDPSTFLGLTTLLGLNITSNLIQYFRRYDATTGVCSDSAGTAVSFTMASSRIHPTDLGVSHLQVARTGFEAHGLSSTTTHPIAVSVTATVPTVP
jgi:hypothetical protein